MPRQRRAAHQPGRTGWRATQGFRALPGRELWARVWQARVGHIRLYLLDANTPENNEQDRELTLQLYGGDSDTRISQEIPLGIGGTRALAALGIKPAAWHINEGHAAFQILSAAGWPWKTASVSEAALNPLPPAPCLPPIRRFPPAMTFSSGPGCPCPGPVYRNRGAGFRPGFRAGQQERRWHLQHDQPGLAGLCGSTTVSAVSTAGSPQKWKAASGRKFLRKKTPSVTLPTACMFLPTFFWRRNGSACLKCRRPPENELQKPDF